MSDELVEKIARAIAREEHAPEINDGRLIVSDGDGNDLYGEEAITAYVDQMWECYVEHARACLSEIEDMGMVVVPRVDVPNRLSWAAAPKPDGE